MLAGMGSTVDAFPDPLVGRRVEICSVAGITYAGTVHAIRCDDDLGELFELRSEVDPTYQRLVYVADRLVQVRGLDEV